MKFDVEANELTLKYKDFTALKDISFKLEDEKIYGLIGRNGAGKTSLLSMMASLREATAGSLTIAGEIPLENAHIMQNVAFIAQTDYSEETAKVSQMLDFVRRYRPNYDAEYADYLVKRFKLPLEKTVNKLSKGMQSVMNVIMGLASRTPVTIFDEAYLGMDAPTRVIFYQELLNDQEKHPRLFILSTHLVSEMDYLFDEVLILHQGKLLLHEEFESLVSRGVTITGAAESVDGFVREMGIKKLLGEQRLGNTKAVTMYQEQNEEIWKEAHQRGLEVSNISLQDLFIYLTEEQEEATEQEQGRDQRPRRGSGADVVARQSLGQNSEKEESR
jgi:ABC-2 type transport system ATP-binding protein